MQFLQLLFILNISVIFAEELSRGQIMMQFIQKLGWQIRLEEVGSSCPNLCEDLIDIQVA